MSDHGLETRSISPQAITPNQTSNKTSFSYHSEKPEAVSARDTKKILSFTATLPHSLPARSCLFAVQFPTMGGAQYLLLTKKLTDVVVAIDPNDGTWRLSFNQGATMPDGMTLVRAKRISDSDWDELARQPCYRNTFSEPPSERGSVLADSMAGARFVCPSDGTEIFVTTDLVGTGVDVFVRPIGERMRRRMNLMND